MRAALVLAFVAACSRGGGVAPPPPEPTEADQRADCQKVLDHTWKLLDGAPDHPKTKGARRERELQECMAHLTPDARDCVLAAVTYGDVAQCEELAR